MFTPTPHSLANKFRFFITANVSRILKAFGYKQKQLIICGFPRSGTSLLYNMMSTTTAEKFIFTEFENYFMFTMHKMGCIASKAPLDIMHLEYIDKLNIHQKELALVIVIRDLRDIVTSKHPINPSAYFIGHDYSFWPKDSKFENWEHSAPGVIQISSKIQEASKRPYTLIIKYEDLVSKPDLVQKQICDFFSYSANLPFSEYHTQPDKLAYKYTGRYAARDESLVLEGKKIENKKQRWDKPEHRDRIIEQFTTCPALFDLLIEYGYESNRDWFSKI